MSIHETLTYGDTSLCDSIPATGKPKRLPNVWVTGGARGIDEPDGAIFVTDVYVSCDQRDTYGIVEFANPNLGKGAMENHTIRVGEPFTLQIRHGHEEIPGSLTWEHTPELGTTTRNRQ